MTIDDLLQEDFSTDYPDVYTAEEAPTTDYSRSFNRPSYYVNGENGELKNRDQYISDWNTVNPLPEKPAVVEAEKVQQPTYAELLAAYEKQPKEASDKAKRARIMVAGIGDMLSAVANMVGAYNSGVYVAPKTTLTEAMQARYDKMEKDQKEDREKYNAMLLKRAQLMQRDYIAKQKANDAKAAAQNKANSTAYDNAMKARNAQLNAELNSLARKEAAESTRKYRSQQQENFEKTYNQRQKNANRSYAAQTAPTVSESTYTDPITGKEVKRTTKTQRKM